MVADDLTFIARDGVLHVRRALHVAPVRVRGRVLAWGPGRSDAAAVAREMLVASLQDPDPPDRLVRAFAVEVVTGLPDDHLELRAADVLAWVLDLGTSQHDDLREERRPHRLHELGEYDEDRPDPSGDAVGQAGGGVAEGFEAAEAALIALATHADPGGDPGRDAFAAEAESDRAATVYAEADGDASEDRRRP